MVAQIVFWIAVGLLAYTYIGYALILALLARIKGRPATPECTEWPKLTALAVAFNEEEQILNKVRNILDNGYPEDRIEVIVCSDGSTDNTNRLVEEYGDPRVHLVVSPTNIGVNAAFAMGAKEATGDVFLMTDGGGALFEPGAIRKVARHFADPRVGLVSGHIRFENPQKSAVGSGYRSYWQMETKVRQWESHLGLGCVIVGAFEMIRREAYLPIPSEYTNDMGAALYAHSLGYQCRYEPEAVLVAQQTKTAGQDLARRTRMAVRGWSSVPYLLGKVPLLKDLGNWLAIISHKYARWFAGVFLVLLLVANAFLLDVPFYQVTFAVQAAGYAMAAVGWLLALLGKRLQPFSLAFYFCLLQTAGLLGLIQALCGKKIGKWVPVD